MSKTQNFRRALFLFPISSPISFRHPHPKQKKNTKKLLPGMETRTKLCVNYLTIFDTVRG